MTLSLLDSLQKLHSNSRLKITSKIKELRESEDLLNKVPIVDKIATETLPLNQLHFLDQKSLLSSLASINPQPNPIPIPVDPPIHKRVSLF